MLTWIEELLMQIFGWQPKEAHPTKCKLIVTPPLEPEVVPKETPIPKPKPPTTIKEVAKSLCIYNSQTHEMHTLMTAKNVEKWILENIDYTFHWNPQGIKLTWKFKDGDCTDRAMLAQKMLEYLNIDSQLRHGWVGNSEKYDWVETDEYALFVAGYRNVDDVGSGIW